MNTKTVLPPRMDLLNELRQIATATRVDALKLHDSTAKSVALARADQLGDMCAATAELLDAVAGYLGYQDSMHFEALRDAFRRVNGSQP